MLKFLKNLKRNKKIVFNFSAGPAMLPKEVLNQIQHELCNWNGMGMSIMEISHRSNEFLEIVNKSEKDLRDLLHIPSHYKVLFCHGGARTHFSTVPMNLLKRNTNIDYINSGYWSRYAIAEAKKYCIPKIINILSNENGFIKVKKMKDWKLSNNCPYIHFCQNETVDGISINELPNFKDKIVIADCSSSILSRPIDINRFGLIYASAQKNISISGFSIVIIREDLFGTENKFLPSTFNYRILSEKQSMSSTPPTFAWYIASLVFQWIKKKGGLIEIEKMNRIKSNLLYKTIDSSQLYYNSISPKDRSTVNVTFQLKNEKLHDLFIKKSISEGLYFLRGHKSKGGMRASLYNAMTIEGVIALTNFMKRFSYRYG